MAETINNLDGRFVATVKGYNRLTRELEVFIPKLMPAIPEGQSSRTILTNLGNKNIKIKHSDNIKLKSTIRVKAKDKDSEIPTIGSRVLVIFLDNKFELGYWEKFNMSGDYEVIDEEKYQRSFFITIGNKKFEVNRDDNIQIELPEGYKVVYNEKGKDKIIRLSKDDEYEERIRLLETSVGIPTIEKATRIDEKRNPYEVKISATGLYKQIEELEKRFNNCVKNSNGGN